VLNEKNIGGLAVFQRKKERKKERRKGKKK
jgi:hypothetical protein